MSAVAKVAELPAQPQPSASEPEPLQIDVSDLFEAYRQIAAEQITGLIGRVAELEATVAAQRRQLAARG